MVCVAGYFLNVSFKYFQFTVHDPATGMMVLSLDMITLIVTLHELGDWLIVKWTNLSCRLLSSSTE